MAKSKELTNWKEDLQKAAEKTAKNERPNESFISLKGGVMTYQDQPLPDNMLECVVIASSFARTFFDRPYDADDTAPPECFANAIDLVDLIPHENVLHPMSNSVCSEKECEYAVFGSAAVGKGPACKTRRKLIVMPISGLDNPAEAEIATIACPPTSGKNWSSYAAKVANSSGLPPWGVTTRIRCKPHAKRQFEVVFEAMDVIKDDKTLAALHARINEAERLLLTPYTYEPEAEGAEDTDKKKKKF